MLAHFFYEPFQKSSVKKKRVPVREKKLHSCRSKNPSSDGVGKALCEAPVRHFPMLPRLPGQTGAHERRGDWRARAFYGSRKKRGFTARS